MCFYAALMENTNSDELRHTDNKAFRISKKKEPDKKYTKQKSNLSEGPF